MEKSTISSLILNWEFMRDALAPSRVSGTLLHSQQQPSTILSVFTSRREYWEFFVGLVGYATNLGEKDALTLEQIVENPDSQIGNIRDYFSNVASLPVDEVLSAGFGVAQIMSAYSRSQLIEIAFDFESCEKRCKESHPNNYAAYQNCVLKC